MNRTRHKTSTLARDESGAAALEFAIVSTAFCMFLIAISYMGIMLYTDLAVHWALEKGARLAAVNTSTTQSTVASTINGYLSGLGVSSATVTYSVSNGSYKIATITASLAQSYSIPLLKTFDITYSATTQVPQNTPG